MRQILIPVKYPEYANSLTSLALFLVRIQKRDHDLVCLERGL